jgi:tetratricopeptide (TPR) repeat protein
VSEEEERSAAVVAAPAALRDKAGDGLNYYKRVLTVDPKHVVTLCALGILHHEQGRPEKARDYYEQALAVDSKHVFTLCNLGDLHPMLH